MTQYVFDGSSWRRESAAALAGQKHAASGGLNLWRTPQPQNAMYGYGARFELYRSQPCFFWLGQWTRDPQGTLAGFVDRAAGQVLPLCVYGFPRSGYSQGGFNSLGAYRGFIDSISRGIGAAPCLLVLEPDALGLHKPMADGTRPETALAYAVARFGEDNPRTAVHLDAASWVAPAAQARRLRDAGVAAAAGFSTNVSNFKSTQVQADYCDAVNAHLERLGVPAKPYLIDTGRNGNGHLTGQFGRAANDWLHRGEGWLNPPGRGLGLSPRADPDPRRPNFAAAVWVKNPGNSDGDNPGRSWQSGYFPDRAPAAGHFWLSWIQDCLKHTDMTNLRQPD